MSNRDASPSPVQVRVGETTYTFDHRQTVTVGRSTECDVVVSDDSVSRTHLTMQWEDSGTQPGWVIRDSGSANGVYLKSRRAKKIRVVDHAIIRLGEDSEKPELEIVVLPAVQEPDDETVMAGEEGFADETLTVAVTDATVLGAPAHAPTRTPAQAGGESLQRPAAEGPPPIPRNNPTLVIERRKPVSRGARSGGGEAAAFPSPHFVIGKSSTCNFILNDVLVSRRHAQLESTEEGLWLVDLGSLNGTFLNGSLIERSLVHEGDVITLGNTDLTIRDDQLDYLRAATEKSGGLVVDNLEFAIKGGKKLLRGIDLNATPGSLTAVIGPSGAGKSTLSRVLAGVTSPSAGTVSFDGFDVQKNFELIRSRIGLVPQDDVLHTTLKLEQALRYAARLRLRLGDDKQALNQQVDKVIDELELSNHRHTRIDRLSGGQRKRASVALELLTEPSLLILDEPTSGLDPALDRQVMSTLRTLATGNRAVLVITHSVAYLDMCDKVLVLTPGGMPAYYGPPAQLRSYFGTDDWADIFAGLTAHPEQSFEEYRSRTPHRKIPAEPESEKESSPTQRRKPKWSSQFTTLCRRQFSLILADRGYLVFLLILPIVVGLLVLVVPGTSGLGWASRKIPGEPTQLLSMLVIGASFMGASISIRDLVGERPVFLRERAVGLPISAYLASKIVVFGIFAWLMAGVLTLVTFASKPGPTQSLIFGDAKFELFLALGLTSMCSMTLGLLLSSLVRSTEQAMPLLIIVLMAQLVLNGGLLPVGNRPGLTELASIILARWGFAMASTSIDIQNLSPNIEGDPLWNHDVRLWVFAAGMLLIFTVLYVTLTRLRLNAKYIR